MWCTITSLKNNGLQGQNRDLENHRLHRIFADLIVDQPLTIMKYIALLVLLASLGCSSTSSPGSNSTTLTFPLTFTGRFHAHHFVGDTNCTMTLSRADDTLKGDLLLLGSTYSRKGSLRSSNIYSMDTIYDKGSWVIPSGGTLTFNSDKSSFVWILDNVNTGSGAIADTIIAKR